MAGRYTIYFTLNGVSMVQFFEFTLINSFLDATTSTTTYYGYKGYTEFDCLYVNRPFYVKFDMKDIYSNDIPNNDVSAYLNVIAATLTNGIYYVND